MLISTKGRYALRLMVCVASQGEERKTSLREVSESEDISLKYLEQLARPLVQGGLLRSVRGKGGGYQLGRPASQITAGDVLAIVEGTTVPVGCSALDAGLGCPRSQNCSTVAFWTGLDKLIENYVNAVTLQDLVDGVPLSHVWGMGDMFH